MNGNESSTFDWGDTLKVDAKGWVKNEFGSGKYFRMTLSAYEVGNPNVLVETTEQTVYLNPGTRKVFALTVSHDSEEPIEQYYFTASLSFLDAIGGLESHVAFDSEGQLFIHDE